jgi:integrase
MSKMRYLVRRRGGGLAVKIAKPKHLCPGGKTMHVVRGLGTQDINEAQRLKWLVIAEIRTEWAREENPELSLSNEALLWKKDLETAADPTGIKHFLVDRAYEIEKKHGEEAALRFARKALGVNTLSTAIEQWEAHEKGRLKPKTIAGDLKEMTAFTKWAGDMLVKDVDRVTAHRYVTESLLEVNAHGRPPAPATVRRKLSSLSKLFKYAALAGLKTANPFDGLHALARGGKNPGGSAGKVSVTKEEVRRITAWIETHSKEKDRELMRDVGRLLMHTGMRFGEAVGLTGADIEDDDEKGATWLFIREGKTDNSKRSVPVTCPELRKALKARRELNGSDLSRLLFHELKGSARVADPEKALGKRLRRVIRNALPERVGKVDVHSFRRFFATIAEDQGVSDSDLARIMGHTPESFSKRVYSTGPGKERLVEAMRTIEGGMTS